MLEFAVSKDAHVFGACGLFKFVGAARLLPRLRWGSLRSEAAIELMRPSGKGGDLIGMGKGFSMTRLGSLRRSFHVLPHWCRPFCRTRAPSPS